jgi:replication factor C small subunit|tara:strand:- start:204 stop:389 length:186 start_codon:yes stop_codon:yes gene_type:complete
LRRILNELHRYSSSGIIDSEILKDYEVANIEELSDLLRNKKFDDVRQWIVAKRSSDKLRKS